MHIFLCLGLAVATVIIVFRDVNTVLPMVITAVRGGSGHRLVLARRWVEYS
jgi:hypothetical protein